MVFLPSSSLLVSSAEPKDHDRDKYETSQMEMWDRGDIPGMTSQGTREEIVLVIDKVGGDGLCDL